MPLSDIFPGTSERELRMTTLREEAHPYYGPLRMVLYATIGF
jgi:hypothetical protein